MDENKALINLERLAFEKIEYHRDVLKPIDSADYDMNFVRTVYTAPDNIHCKVELTANITSKTDGMQITVTMTGFFSSECNNEALRTKLFNENTVAIMFPYLRSQISLITTQPDIPPITIPPVNIVELFKNPPKEAE